MILEIGKSYINKFYGGDLKAAIKEKDGILYTPEIIKLSFNNGSGSKKDLKRWIKDNKNFAFFVEV